METNIKIKIEYNNVSNLKEKVKNVVYGVSNHCIIDLQNISIFLENSLGEA